MIWLNDNIEESTFADKWKALGNTFAFVFGCYVAYLESMYGKKEVEKFLSFTADQAKFAYAPLKRKPLEKIAKTVFDLGQSFFEIKSQELSPNRCMIETECLMRSSLIELSLRSDLLCKFCEQVIKEALVSCVECEMKIELTPEGCNMILST